MAACSTPKIFGGSGQYRTWSFGINAGVLSPFVAIGGSNSYKNADIGFGYGVSLRDQLAHSFGLQLDVMGYGSQFGGHTSETGTAANQAHLLPALITQLL